MKNIFLQTAGLKNGSTELNIALLSIAGFQVFFTAVSSLIVDKTGKKEHNLQEIDLTCLI